MTAINTKQQFTIRIPRKRSGDAKHVLQSGRSIFLGTGDTCGIKVLGDNVAAIHCLLAVEDHAVYVQDWASPTGTLINGRIIEEKTQFKPGDTLRIGDVSLSLFSKAIATPEFKDKDDDHEEAIGMESLGLEDSKNATDQAPVAPDHTDVGNSLVDRLSDLIDATKNIDSHEAVETGQTPEEAPAQDSLANENQSAETIDDEVESTKPTGVLMGHDAFESLIDNDFDEDDASTLEDFQSTSFDRDPMDATDSDSSPFNSFDSSDDDSFGQSDHFQSSDVDTLDLSSDDDTLELSSDADTLADPISESDEALAIPNPHTHSTSTWQAVEATPGTQGLDWGDQEESVAPEVVELLKAEIEDLQAQLAERDLELADFAGLDSPTSATAHSLVDANDQNPELEARVEELLAELAEHDERVSTLQQLLEASEMQIQNQQAERDSLETWVGEIEQRIAGRENEWQAEMDALKTRLEQTTEERDLLERRLVTAAQRIGTDAPDTAATDKAVEQLQRKNRSLQSDLDESQKRCATLSRQMERAKSESEEKLQAAIAEVAQEKAELSRKQVEMQKQIHAIDQPSESKDVSDREFAHKLQTLREHLREIHEEEQEKSRGDSLFQRISGLWKRVDDEY
ncbi:MAG: hypothetical protein CBB71_05390 [Rhodopirellula sp. TMED11]|nr:MAG: hypothetical protein CBB71_05390 [Rhodopirellula sp. TMED11]